MFKIFNKMLDIVFPENITCNLCSKEIFYTEFSLCDDCYKYINFNFYKKKCNMCGREISHFSNFNKCLECMKNDYYFDCGSSCVEFSGGIEKLILDYKYRESTHLYKSFSEMIIKNLKLMNWEIDIITFVPIHFTRRLIRGFNQSEMIAKSIAEEMNIECKSTLVRVKRTKRLKKLSKEERLFEIKDAFKLKDGFTVEGKNILLIDDIFTTGTTLNFCSKVLKENGANKIFIHTVAVKSIDRL